MPRRVMAILPLVELLSGSVGAATLAAGGIAVAALDLWRAFRAG